MGMELRIREPRAEDVAPLRGVAPGLLSEGEEEET